MHVDKDEDAAVRARGDPIVSLSVGDAADFAYGPRHFSFDADGVPFCEESPTDTTDEQQPQVRRHAAALLQMLLCLRSRGLAGALPAGWPSPPHGGI